MQASKEARPDLLSYWAYHLITQSYLNIGRYLSHLTCNNTSATTTRGPATCDMRCRRGPSAKREPEEEEKVKNQDLFQSQRKL